jgi:nicotinate-nucleotide adenylyltransferase
MRIGLFGGTFNPIHIGHLRSAVDVQMSFGLDRVYFIPAAIPPHKDVAGIVDARTRMEMVRIAVKGRPGLEASDVEMQRSGPSFTTDTVSQFQSRFSDNGKLFLIVGLDAFLEIDTWKDFLSLFANIAFIVMIRPAVRKDQAVVSPEYIEEYLQTHISNAYVYDSEQSQFLHPSLQTVHLSPVTLLDISASKIRGLVAAKSPIGFLVPKSVEDFIYEKGLYR